MGWKYQFDSPLLPAQAIDRLAGALVARWPDHRIWVDIIPSSDCRELDFLLETELEQHPARYGEIEDAYIFALDDAMALLHADSRFVDCTLDGSLLLCFANDLAAFPLLPQNGYNQTPAGAEMLLLEITRKPASSLLFSAGLPADVSVAAIEESFFKYHDLGECLLPEGSHLHINYANEVFELHPNKMDAGFLSLLQCLRDALQA